MMSKKDKIIKQLRDEIKQLEAEVERQKMLNLSKPIYVEPVKQQAASTCSNCGGTGHIQVFYPADNTTGDSLQACPICNGSGVIYWNGEITISCDFVSYL